MARFSDVEVFLAVARTGSLSSAAQRLTVTEDTVQQCVSRLERFLNTKLFDTGPDNLSLSASGIAYERWALTSVQNAPDSLRGSPGAIAISGTVRLAAPRLLGQTVLVPMLAPFLTTHSGIRLGLKLTDEPMDPVHHNVDVVLRVGIRENRTHLNIRRLATVRSIAVATPEIAKRLDFGDHQVPAVIFEQPDGSSRSIHNAPFRYTPRISVNDDTLLREMVLKGIGVGVLPDLLVDQDLLNKRLIHVATSWVFPELQVWAAFVRSNSRPPCEKLLLAYLTEGFSRFNQEAHG